MVSFQSEVVHFSVAFVTYSVQLIIVQGELSPLVTADFTNRPSATLTVFHWYSIHNFELVCKGSFTELASFGLLHFHTFQIEVWWQSWLIEEPIVIEIWRKSVSRGGWTRHCHRLRGHLRCSKPGLCFAGTHEIDTGGWESIIVARVLWHVQSLHPHHSWPAHSRSKGRLSCFTHSVCYFLAK